MDTLKTMAERIVAARKARKMSRPELAKRCNVSRGAVAHWETGRTMNLRNETLLGVSAALQVNMRWLLSGEGERDLTVPAEKAALYQRWIASFHGLGTDQIRTMLSMLEPTIAQQSKGELQMDAIEHESTPEVEK